jgi:hypothetical protein
MAMTGMSPSDPWSSGGSAPPLARWEADAASSVALDIHAMVVAMLHARVSEEQICEAVDARLERLSASQQAIVVAIIKDLGDFRPLD